MPELPEVEVLARFLSGQAVGRRVERAELGAIWALKTYDPPLDSIVGREIRECGRRGKYLLLVVGGMTLAVHFGRAGWLRWYDPLPSTPVKLGRSPVALRLRLDGGVGFDLTERGTEKRLAVWVVQQAEDVPHIAGLGADPLASGFDVAAFGLLLSGSNAQLKGVLTDQSIVAGVGNAYSDEALHLAGLSPFRRAGSLDESELGRLHAALIGVLTEAIARADGLPAARLKDEKRSGMRVHGRTGQACPECGDTVREVSFATKSLQYCPTCQTGGKPLADRRRSRLLK